MKCCSTGMKNVAKPEPIQYHTSQNNMFDVFIHFCSNNVEIHSTNARINEQAQFFSWYLVGDQPGKNTRTITRHPMLVHRKVY